MPRANRYLAEGRVYHLTHRCHNKMHLLQCVQDRDTYRRWLYAAERRYGISVYAYCVMSNHVHVLLRVHDRECVARFMDLAAGATARSFNRRKSREGAFWSGRYSATAVESGRHLWRCLVYIHMNAVRAGLASAPSDWRWSGHAALTGARGRHRIVDLKSLVKQLEATDTSRFQEQYNAAVRTAVEARQLARQPEWTESLAVGSRDFVARVARENGRTKVQYSQLFTPTDRDAWSVREHTRKDAYSAENAPYSGL